ncbi:ABC transporter ATP-binding protein [Listeria aquatica]|uniref:ABC transporter ATP-binding protein n=1 Tax=Listeria aquatica TaxID=1494960 RepID=A0A841ZTT1_9LIST|nr:ABC transporter ATP-binding protein [Listeria aquatica]MBC1522575.1 ABC transporter ATP-binding protein [Listeria aquatica]
MITIENLSVKIGKNLILDHLSLKIRPSEIIGLVAPNGTGKTTLLRSISGLQKITSGKISIESYEMKEATTHYCRSFFYLQNIDLLYPELTVIEHLRFVKYTWKSDQQIEQILDLLQMTAYQHKKISKLSFGMKQHLLIAMAIISDAPNILMDEPFNGLDPTSIHIVTRAIHSLAQTGKAFLFSSHILNHIDQTCSKVLFLQNKKIEYILDFSKFPDKKAEEIYHNLYEGDDNFESTTF